jgi:hypothetical protein
MRRMNTRAKLLVAILTLLATRAAAQSELFDFDSVPAHTPLPLDLTVGNVTASFSGTGQGFSIQLASSPGVTPAGFAGNSIYPNSILPADLLVGFSWPVRDISIMYAPNELGCDTSATMRITGYMDAAFVATSTATAPNPGTWPTGVLSLSAPGGFNRVVIHYDGAPPACGEWGPIFMADNMTVTPFPSLSIDDVTSFEGDSGTTTFGFNVSLSAASDQTVTVNYATADWTATTADGDYVATSGTLTFAPGVTTQPVSVTVNGDVKNEADEIFLVNLSDPVNAPLSASQGIGTIANDDDASTFGLIASTAGPGTGSVRSSPAGIDCGVDCSERYAPGTVVTLTAEPAPGSTFEGWGGSCSGTSLVCQLIMDTDRTATATFALSPPAGASYFTVSPCRVLDSRATTGQWGGAPLGAQQERTATVAGACGIPASANAVSFNLAATAATVNGHLRLYPAGTPKPNISSLNFSAGVTRANNGVVGLAAGGAVTVFSAQASGSVHVILDVSGYFE